ncbi:MAG: alkyl hydroperoxide reductase subunit F [Leptospiraceae bacterium]|nr:alkyl hydroperoxide reductase subunit F [Leptospiraceae bacterium]
MLDEATLSQLQDYFQKITRPVRIQSGPGSHERKAELEGMLHQLAGITPQIHFAAGSAAELDAISFQVAPKNTSSGEIVFSGIPGGHEFSSLILAILQCGGVAPKLDAEISALIQKRIKNELRFETIVSLSCHNCPDVVQTLNSFALLNPLVHNRMIDGALYPDLIAERGIQGVPAVYLNGERFADGKLDPGQILAKILEVLPADDGAEPEAGSDECDVLVIGGGPAGAAAAVYAARKGFDVALVADRIGGQVKDTMAIENLIALHETTGPELAESLRGLLEKNNVRLREHLQVRTIEPGAIHTVTLNTGAVIKARAIAIATGARWRELGVPGEKENIGRGVAYCPHCDGPFFKGKHVAVIGGGNSGVEAALDLAGIVKHVTVLEFLPELKADQVLQDRLHERGNIDVMTNVATDAIETANGAVNQLLYTDRASAKQQQLSIDGVFIQIGLVPNSQFVKEVVETNRFGEIIINDRCATSVPGIFACGDVTTVPYKQIITAMGEGAKAALSIFEYLLKEAVPA